MFDYSFVALGTHWSISIDDKAAEPKISTAVKYMVNKFEKKYSRFLPDSEIALINQSKKKEFSISLDLTLMLAIGKKMESLTAGHFNLNLNRLISGYGYDAKLSFKSRSADVKPPRGRFSLTGIKMTKEPGVELDLGSLGKGYLIDLVAKLLHKRGYRNFIIEGGGDIYATKKANGKPWRVAIEHPLKPDEVIGNMELANRALATSSGVKRRYNNFHHLLDATTALPANDLLCVSVLAKSAVVADACATAVFVSPKELWPKIRREFQVEYLVIYPDLNYLRSGGFPEIF